MFHNRILIRRISVPSSLPYLSLILFVYRLLVFSLLATVDITNRLTLSAVRVRNKLNDSFQFTFTHTFKMFNSLTHLPNTIAYKHSNTQIAIDWVTNNNQNMYTRMRIIKWNIWVWLWRAAAMLNGEYPARQHTNVLTLTHT